MIFKVLFLVKITFKHNKRDSNKITYKYDLNYKSSRVPTTRHYIYDRMILNLTFVKPNVWKCHANNVLIIKYWTNFQ